MFLVVVDESFCWSSDVVIGLGLPFGGCMVVEFDIELDDDDDDDVVVVVVVVDVVDVVVVAAAAAAVVVVAVFF